MQRKMRGVSTKGPLTLRYRVHKSDGRKDRQTDGRTDRQTDGRTDGRTTGISMSYPNFVCGGQKHIATPLESTLVASEFHLRHATF